MEEYNSERSVFSNSKLIIPTFISVGLFVILIFFYIIPEFKNSIMDRKKEMIQQLTNSALSIIEKYNMEIEKKKYDPKDARELAKTDIRFLRYGRENKDYFWIIDTVPNMIMHPYRSQLEGRNLSNEVDKNGKKLFVAMVKLCENDGQGFIKYMWQWKDDPHRVVPKLSYVKKFPQWNWIIGTGIYTDDVEEEISSLIKDLLLVSTAIILIISFFLFYLMSSSLKIEKKRKTAEGKLIRSESKFRSLVEATTQGILIIHKGKIVYSNKFLQKFLEYSKDEFENRDLNLMFGGESNIQNPEYEKIKREIKRGSTVPYESSFIKKSGESVDVLLSISEIPFGEDIGNAIVVNDISGDKKIRKELEHSREQYKNLTDNLKIGVFRAVIEKGGEIVEANPATFNILGYSRDEVLSNIRISELFVSDKKWVELIGKLKESGYVKSEIVEIKRADSTTSILKFSIVLIHDNLLNEKCFDGIIEDITERYRSEEFRDRLMVELKTTQFVFDEPINNYTDEVLSCSMDTPIDKAVGLMSHADQDIIFIKSNISEYSPLTEYAGFVTVKDLRDRVFNGDLKKYMPIMKIMNAPVVTISMNSSIFDALILMKDKNINYLAVTSHDGRIKGVIHRDILLGIQNNSASLLISEVQGTKFVRDVFSKQRRVPALVKVLSDSGANSKIICRKISAITDSILKKLIGFALEELGKPPLKFCFMSLGSEGREEQTLLTDQDNAIIYEDTEDKKVSEEAEKYFLKLGKLVCSWMDKSGYSFCPGNIMAMNPKWNKPISSWKKYFKQWISESTPEDLLEVSIFFDFRGVYGDVNFTEELRRYINSVISRNPIFLQHIVRNALGYKPPIGFFGNILLESEGEKPSTFNIKDPIQLIVNFSRIYSIQQGITDTNTLNRIYKLNKSGVITDSLYRELDEAYDYLMRTRFKHQLEAIEINNSPDNNINPKELTELEQHMLKYIFSQINNFQKKLSYDFTGSA